MASQKKKEILAKLKEAEERLHQEELKRQEIEKLVEEADKEERDNYELTRSQIQALADEKGFFCGAILQKEDILSLVDIAITSKEKIQIPFNLYFKET